jgi:vesicular inhibitory amino acid transporter
MWIVRIICVTLSSVAILSISIIFPGFHKMMALLGSFFSFTVSVLFPEICYLKLHGSSLTKSETAWEITIICVGATCGLVGTIWACLPE